MSKHKWNKEIKAWADGAEIEQMHKINTDGKWEMFNGAWGDFKSGWKFRIKPQHEEEPYWLCCGCKDPRHNKLCLEAKTGHPERCRFGTASEHFKPQPKEPQYLYVYKDYGELCLLEDKIEKPAENIIYIGKIKLEDEQ